MPYSDEKAVEIHRQVQIHGKEYLSQVMGVKVESIERALRHYDRIQTKDLHAKILLMDIETLPPIFYSWSPFPKYLSHEMLIKDWSMICWSAKWLFSSNLIQAKVTGKEAIERDDSRIVKKFWDIINEADIVIAHNLKGFDAKKANSRFLFHELNPPAPYQMIDTLETARKEFGELYNKLDFLSSKFTGEGKIKTEFDWWRACDNGNQEMIDQMSVYCGRDVFALEDYYLRIRPWIKGHPNIALYQVNTEKACRNCGSENLKVDGYYYTRVNRYTSYRCLDCGAFSRSRYTDVSKEEKPHILT